MLSRALPLTFAVTCAVHAYFAASGVIVTDERHLLLRLFVLFGGGAAFVIATILGVIAVRRASGSARVWAKSALVFLALGPAAFWLLLRRALNNTVCIGGGCYGPEAQAFIARAVADIEQIQFSMAAIALAALFCAVHVLTRTAWPTPHRQSA
jgi:hypothetical protein